MLRSVLVIQLPLTGDLTHASRRWGRNSSQIASLWLFRIDGWILLHKVMSTMTHTPMPRPLGSALSSSTVVHEKLPIANVHSQDVWSSGTLSRTNQSEK